MKRNLLLLAALCCGMTLVSGSDADAPSSDKKLKLALVTNNDADYWHLAKAGCEDAGKELGNVEIDFLINKSGDSEGQLRLLQQVMNGKPDGVGVSAVNVFEETEPLSTIAGQTLLVCFDSDASPSKRAGYIGTDNVAAGVQAGELIMECLPEGGKVMLFVGNARAQNAIQRIVGIRRALRDSEIHIVDTITDDTDRARAKQNAADTLTNHPEVTCLVGLWSYEGPALLEAVREAGKIGEVQIVCFDDAPETLVGIGWGAIHGTVVQDPYEIGRQTVIALKTYLGGDTNVFGEEETIHIPTQKIKQDDVSAYLVEQGKLLSQ